MSDADRAVDAQVRADIAARGYHLGIVPALPTACGWAFSAGLLESSKHPDLICFGPDLDPIAGLVQRLCELVRRGERFDERERHAGVLAGNDIITRPVEAKWVPVFLGNTAWLYERDTFPALQCFWPDAGGRFPWDPDFQSEWRDQQPFLFESLTHKALPDGLLQSLRTDGAL